MKEKIMTASLKLFDTNGFSETSIQDLVDDIGVTKGTFYYYFNSKEELLYMIHFDFINYILSKQEKLLEDPTKNSKEKLTGIVSMLVREIKNRKHSARIFFRESRNLKGEHIDNILAKRDKFRLNLEKLITIGIKNGEFRQDLPSDIVSFGILGILNWSYFWYEPTGPVKEDELIKIYSDLLLDGLNMTQ